MGGFNVKIVSVSTKCYILYLAVHEPQFFDAKAWFNNDGKEGTLHHLDVFCLNQPLKGGE